VEVKATEFSSYLPGGKNYLDESNMVFGDNIWSSDDDFLVKGNTTYTLSMPGEARIGSEGYIQIIGEEYYLSGYLNDIEECTIEGELISCSFTTTASESLVSLTIAANDLSMYYGYYQFDEFQLEEGSVSTSHEEYINPLIDTTNPEFTGSGAYITSYQSSESISSIIADHIYAIDDIDGDISSSIGIISDEYTSNQQTVGEYEVILSVSDQAGNTSLFSLTMMVKDEIDPVINGDDVTNLVIGRGEVSLNDLIWELFDISDEYDESPSMNILIDNFTANKDTIGLYSVTFEVVDSSLNRISKTFSINLGDTGEPVMISSNIIDSYLSNQQNLNDIISSLVFEDNYYDLSFVIPTVIIDNYTGNENIPGNYSIKIEVSDDSNNTLSEVITINVVDDVAPVISGIINYSGSYTEELTANDFLSMMNVNDNVDLLGNSDLYIVSDNYTSRTSNLGNFEIVLGLIDTNNNSATHSISINLFDDIAPVIYVDNYIITVDLSSTFTETDALKLLLNSNELKEEEYVITKVIDEYSGNEDNPGSYIYKLAFTNENGDIFEKEFLVKVLGSNMFKIEKALIPRNIAVYSLIVGFSVFIVIKRKKKKAI
jgi:hypothetical protein